MKKNDSLKKLAVCAMMVALSFVLSLWTPFQFWPQGGSVTFGAMVPVVLISLLFGVKWGLGCAFTNAVLQMLMGLSSAMSWGLTPTVLLLCILLDYILAYTVIGLAGCVRGNPDKPWNDGVRAAVGSVLVCLLRYGCHFLSGWALFGAFAEEGYTALGWGLFYNMTFMLPETIITVILSVALSSLFPVLRRNFPFCRAEGE